MNALSKRLTIVGLLAGGVLAALPASAQQFTMKLSQPTINDVTYEFFKQIKAGIEQRSGGKIKVDIYPSNQLGQLPAVVEGVALGTIEAAASANGFWVSLEPRFQSHLPWYIASLQLDAGPVVFAHIEARDAAPGRRLRVLVAHEQSGDWCLVASSATDEDALSTCIHNLGLQP